MADEKASKSRELKVVLGIGGGTARSIQRRLHDIRFATRYFVGRGLDIGAGPDGLALYAELFPRVTQVDTWDVAEGDAQVLSTMPDDVYDFVYSSHCLEHLVDPRDGLRNWFRVLKPGGHLVVVVPDEDLYEQGVFPSTFNTDHKWTFSIHKNESWSDRSINVVDLCLGLGSQCAIHKIELLDAGYRYAFPRFDQTRTPIAESSIELIAQKLRRK